MLSSSLRRSVACAASRGAVASSAAASVSRTSRFVARRLPLRQSAPAASFASTTMPVPMQQLSESFVDGTSASYVEQMYAHWLRDPSSVHVSWDAFFRNVDAGAPPGQAYMSPPTLRNATAAAAPAAAPAAFSPPATPEQLSDATIRARVRDSLQAGLLIRAFQVRGHLLADLDPLHLDKRPVPPELELGWYGFSNEDLDKPIFLSGNLTGLRGPFHKDEVRTLRQIIENMRAAYCGKIGIEYMHIQDRTICDWIRNKVENGPAPLPAEEKKTIFERLAFGTLFERYLAKKFSSAKRFGLDGGESLIPGLKILIDKAAEMGIESIVLGMAHRGRLNVLANVVRKPLEQIFTEFRGGAHDISSKDGEWLNLMSGDVKYHLGTSYDRPTRGGKFIHISLLANPSHLEAVNPLVEGKTRARQFFAGDRARQRNMSLQIHGDASFAGQGVVYETLDLNGLPAYTTGGTVHVVINNQIGFTTDPKSSRCGNYCTDIAKVGNTPILHVNGDDPEAVQRAMIFAVEFRQQFHKDVVVDIVCYRRFGHNEIDQPEFTQPLMYKAIRAHPSTLDLYAKQLVQEGVFDAPGVQAVQDNILKIFDDKFAEAQSYKPKESDWLESRWHGFHGPQQMARIHDTGVPIDILRKVGKALHTVPQGFAPHKTIEKLLQQKATMMETGQGLDWATAEALALGTLLLENNHVRVSGQDVERGTFSHRHAVLHDQNSDKTYEPLSHIEEGGQAEFHIHNSSLSEFAVLGFETGYSMENPNSLTIWEAQFGDFANGAQVIFDQFLSCGEHKWRRQCGLVVLLPHGYDGQGPEHSSARLERFLTMCDSDPTVYPEAFDVDKQAQFSNWQIVNCTTPANYFHVLRRQIHRTFRKPLIVMSPKNLLRHPRAVSPLSAIDDKQTHLRFQRVLSEAYPETLRPDAKINRLLLCSGKVYYELLEERIKRGIDDTAIVRLEQLAPFPWDLVTAELRRYPNAQVIWTQEEPMNMGAWRFLSGHIRTCLNHLSEHEGLPRRFASYAGRRVSASPAAGNLKVSNAEQAQLIDDALAKKFTP